MMVSATSRDRHGGGLIVMGVLSALICIAVIGALFPVVLGGVPGRRLWTVIASSGFVLLAAMSLVHSRRFESVLVFTALVFCWFGDLLGPLDFTVGAMAFFVGHLAFIAAFSAAGIERKRALSAAIVLAFSGLAILCWLLPHVRQLGDRILVGSYLAVISLMTLSASATRHRAWVLSAAAAWLFYVSDIAVARWRFVSPGSENAYFCYPLYYAACTLMAWIPFFWDAGRGAQKD